MLHTLMPNRIRPHSEATPAWHLRAVRLPDGDRTEDWWISDNQLHDHPIEGARDLPGGWVLPGLVDAHAHLTMDFNNTGLSDEALVEANLHRQLKAGVLAVRDMGTVPGAQLLDLQSLDAPRLISSTPFFAPAGGYHASLYEPVAAEQLISAALAEVVKGAPWVKVIADFPGEDGNWFRPRTNYPVEVLRALVEAVHARGARVAVHTTGPFAGECVRAGVDSIEHGPSLQAEAVVEMARRGTAWTPTLATGTRYIEQMAQGSGPVAEAARGSLAHWGQMLALAQRLGVTILTGTDEWPHGSLAAEVAKLQQYGLPARAALASASTHARRYLGLTDFQSVAAADLITFHSDPREDLSVLNKPAAIVARGKRIV